MKTRDKPPSAIALNRVIQAHVSRGALQARVNLWNVKLTAGIHPSGEAIQRKSANGVEAFRVPMRKKSGGLPLPSDVRNKMETAFSADFSDVRVHVGHEATSLGAIAYTWGTNIHFAPGVLSMAQHAADD